MASNCGLCGVCDNRQITKPSEVWCSECDEGLCTDCQEHHSVSKVTKHHATVSMVEYKKLPTEILQVCKKHNEKYEFFCRKHDCPCCKKCLKSHKDYKCLTGINEAIKNVKASNAFYEIEQSLLELVENIKQISTNRDDNLSSLENKKKEIKADIKQTRTKINHHLDKLQEDLMKELMAMEQKESNKIRQLLTTLRQKEQEIAKYQANFAYIKHYASELQTFLSMKNIQKDMAVEETFIQSLTKNDTLNQVNISYQINKSLQQITANVQRFGDINVRSDPCDFSIQKRKDRQAQIMVAFPNRNIDNLTLTLQKSINTDLSNVQGCSLLPDGRMIFSCHYQNKIKVLKSDGVKDFEINKIGFTFDVLFIGDDSIAVTSGESCKINIIDLKKHKLKTSINVKSGNDGAVYKAGHLIYCAREKGLQMISLGDESITNVTSNELSNYAYVATSGDKLFYTNYDNHSVTCCDYHGNILWTFSDTSVLMTPLGISVDSDGNVFVVGYNSHNVVVISPDGQRYRQLLSREDGLMTPTVLHYDTSTNKLLVANCNKDALMYVIKYFSKNLT